ncbi:MAG: transporter substrate-binding domain-containing protein [Rhizobiales bacterium]|nr:transporter substrate-binding domain-containing protein [Hyphomicrobiales bacterium]
MVASTLLAGLDVPRAVAAEARPEVTIPNFWDPKRRVERPPAGAVQAIRFVTTDDYPPFNFLDTTGHLTGFNIDLARAICAELAIPCTIQARPWSDLAAAVENKNADAIIAGIAITADARAKLDFSDVYLRSPARFVVRRGAAPPDITPAGLTGRTVAVVERTAHAAYLAAFFPKAVAKAYPNADAARAALKAGEAEALFGDGVQSSFWLQSEAAGNCCAFAGGAYLEPHFFGNGMAIAVPPDAGDLRRALNAAMESIHDKGVYAELYLRYFPVSLY